MNSWPHIRLKPCIPAIVTWYHCNLCTNKFTLRSTGKLECCLNGLLTPHIWTIHDATNKLTVEKMVYNIFLTHTRLTVHLKWSATHGPDEQWDSTYPVAISHDKMVTEQCLVILPIAGIKIMHAHAHAHTHTHTKQKKSKVSSCHQAVQWTSTGMPGHYSGTKSQC